MIRKRNVILGAIAVVIFVAALLSLRQPASASVLRRAQVKLASEKTMHVEVKAELLGAPSVLGADAIAAATGVTAVISEDLDRTDPVHPSSVAQFDIRQPLKTGQERLAGEARHKDGTYYLRLTTADGLAETGANKLIGVWAKHGRPFTDFIVPPPEQALGEHPLDADGVAAMTQAFSNVDLFSVDGILDDQKIDGASTYHYSVQLNMQAVSALLLKLRELRSAAPLTSDDILGVTSDVIRWGHPTGEIWIGKRDGRVRRLQLKTTIGADVAGGTLQADFSRYGAAVDVTAPDAQDIEALLGPAFSKRLSLAGTRTTSAGMVTQDSSSAGLPKAPGSEAQVADGDGDGLSDAQEAFYGTDAWSPDTDADGWSDGTEVASGMNPVGPGPLFGFGL